MFHLRRSAASLVGSLVGGLIGGLVCSLVPARAEAAPNLAFYQYPGWAHVLVPRPSADASVGSVPEPSTLPGNACGTFWNFGGWNASDVSTGAAFYVFLYVDGGFQYWVSYPSIGAYGGFYAVNVGPLCLAGGRHTFEAALDPTTLVAESNENDNRWARQWILSPLLLTPGQTSQRAAPPDRYAGTASVVDGSPVYPNNDGLRVNPQAWWTAVPASALNSTDDDDVFLYAPSTGATNGFGSWTAASAAGAGYLDFVVINSNTMGFSPWDVGIHNYSGGSSDYRVAQVTNNGMTFGSAVVASFAQNEMLKLWEVAIGPTQVGAVTISVTQQPVAAGPLRVAWLSDNFFTGGRFNATATASADANGRAKIELNVPNSGYYCVVVYRDPIDGTGPVDCTLRVQQTPVSLRAWSLRQIASSHYLAEVDPHLGVVNTLGFISDNLTNPQLASDPLHDRLYILSMPLAGPPAALLTVQPSTMHVLSQVPVSAFGARGFYGLARNPLTGKLYTLAFMSFGEYNWTELLTIDPSSGTTTGVGVVTNFPSAPMEFSPTGIPHSLFDDLYLSLLVVRQLDVGTLAGSVLGSSARGVSDDWQETAFLGDELWGLNIGPGYPVATRIDAFGHPAESMNLGSVTLHGLAMRSCVTASPQLTAADVDNDAGGQIQLDWQGYVPPGGVIRYEILRAQDPCDLLDPDLLPIGSVNAPTQRFIDATAVNYTSFYYGVRVVLPGKMVVETLYAGPAFCFPNVLINEFSTRSGLKQPPRAKDGSVLPKVGETVEIRNLSASTLDLTGFRLSNGPGFPTPDEETLSGTVPAHGLFLHTLTVIDLPDLGGTLALLPPVGTSFVFDIVAYGTAGGAPAAPPGFTISRVEGTKAGDPDATSFETSTSTFGQTNSVPTPNLGGSIVINEVLYTSGSGGDYIELYNPLGSAVVLNQFAVGDGVNFLTTLSSGLQLAPGQLMVLQQGAPGSFTQDLQSGLLYLYKITAAGQFWRVDQLGWLGGPTPGAAPNDALVRVPDGLAVYLGNQGANWLECGGNVTLKYGPRTPGQPNRDPSVTQVVVDKTGAGNFTSITAALAAVSAGTRVLVNPGTYPESFSLRDGIEIRGAGSNPAAVVVTGSGVSSIVTANGVGSTAVLAGLTIRGSNATQGGALIVSSASPILRNVRFEQNRASQRGGAVLVQSGSPAFDGCFFYKNHAGTDGGAIAVLAGTSSVTSCLFVLNEAVGRGGALFSAGGSTTAEHCVLDQNAAYAAGAGVVHAANGVIDLQYSIVTKDVDGAPLVAEGNGALGHVSLHCGDLFGHSEWFNVAAGGMDTSSVSLADPVFCQPLALNYAYQDASPLVAMSARCGGTVGIAGPPCAGVATGTELPAAPRVTRLDPPAPNPFNPATVLRFELATPGKVTLAVYDLRGRRVTELVHGEALAAGAHDVTWHGVDGSGHRVASGVYLVRLIVDEKEAGEPQRLVLLK